MLADRLSEKNVTREATAVPSGLSTSEAEERLKQYGRNKIEKEEHKRWWSILLRQFKSAIVYLLLFAAAMSFYFREWMDGGAILAVIFINTIIGFYMEYQASRSMEALQSLAIVSAKVVRNGNLIEINSEDIVPGDLVYVEGGDIVPADGHITKLSRLQVNESALTGESVPVEKSTERIASGESLADQTDSLFKGTFISNGNAYYTVSATGMKTELGKIAGMIRSAEQAATPLEKKLEAFTRKLIRITVVLVIVIFAVGLLVGHELVEMINTSIALAVAAIPEGLPIVATLGLARGMLKMARHNVVVKKLSAVETLGGTSVICTDKTGTLTENRMTVKEIIPMGAGSGSRDRILNGFILCNTAEIDKDGRQIGDPLEVALLNYAAGHVSVADVRSRFEKLDEEPFSSDTKRMITLHKSGNRYFTFAKGAVEAVLDICKSSGNESKSLSGAEKNSILKDAERLASSGYKVIGLAYNEQGTRNATMESDLVFIGIIGLIDPPRKAIDAAISECYSAGIKVVMITGDHPSTAKEIARQLGMHDSGHVILGAQMKTYEQLSAGEKKTWLDTNVFARVTPAQKLDLIKLYQGYGNVVGMTGDGVNDAPALKKADIGIAMGLRGTQVAQDVADMVLKDDSFSSIVTAIRQGRIIFGNIRKFLIFLLSCNLSELFTIAVTAILNLHFQLFPLQILFINLITDVLPALALGMTPGDKNIMKVAPKKSGTPIIDNAQWKAVVFYSVVISAASLGAVLTNHFLLHEAEGWNPQLCNNILFFTLIGSQLLHVLNMNSSGTGFFTSEVMRNKYVWYALSACVLILALLYEIEPMRNVLSIYSLSLVDWSVIFSFSLMGMIANQMAKVLKTIQQ